LTDVEDGFLVGKRYLIHNRDPLFTAEFRETLAAAGTESVQLSFNSRASLDQRWPVLAFECLDLRDASLRTAFRSLPS
jgi:hypothetical protein